MLSKFLFAATFVAFILTVMWLLRKLVKGQQSTLNQYWMEDIEDILSCAQTETVCNIVYHLINLYRTTFHNTLREPEIDFFCEKVEKMIEKRIEEIKFVI